MKGTYAQKLALKLIALVLLSSHCSWTPEVNTPVHQSQQGSVTLQTTDSFEQAPSHPITLSPSLLQRVLRGITKSPEQGLVQDLIMGSASEQPVFSDAQIAFLSPHLISALSQATPDELIAFTCSSGVDQGQPLKGTLAAFSPSILVIALNKDPRSVSKPKKQTNPSGYFQGYHTLHFSTISAVLAPEKAQQYMTHPSSSGWIAIDLAHLSSSPMTTSEPPPAPIPSPSPNQSTTDPTPQPLEKQLEELRQKVEEQDREIQRLQQSHP